jgi:hypothetical protein
MRAAALLMAASLPLLCQRGPGLAPRSDPGDYAARGEDKGIRVAAEVLSPDNVRNMFSTDLSSYIVVEVALWPGTGKPLDVSPVDFALKLDGGRSPIRPVSPRTVAGVIQRKGESRRDDITLYPNVGLHTGSWGTGTSVGVGVGVGGGAPGPASTDRDRRTMELELEEKGLNDTVTQKPVAGYLYFPAGSKGKKAASAGLTYEIDGASVQLTLPLDRN